MFGEIMDAIGGGVGAIDGGGSGDFLSELMDAFEGSNAQQGNGSNEAGQIVSDVLPLVAAFL
jgi:hypothetical protein